MTVADHNRMIHGMLKMYGTTWMVGKPNINDYLKSTTKSTSKSLKSDSTPQKKTQADKAVKPMGKDRHSRGDES